MIEKTALITGVAGQDGACLAEFPLGKGNTMHGLKRRTSPFNKDRIDQLYQPPHAADRRCIRDFVDAAGSELGIRLQWQGEDIDETGIVVSPNASVPPGQVTIRVDSRHFRPTEVETLPGDSSRALEKLGWTPGTTFKERVPEMAREDFKSAQRDALIRARGCTA